MYFSATATMKPIVVIKRTQQQWLS